MLLAGATRPAASVNAVVNAPMLKVRFDGVGEVKSAAKMSPTTCVDDALVPDGLFAIANPVMNSEAAGERPTFPARQ